MPQINLVFETGSLISLLTSISIALTTNLCIHWYLHCNIIQLYRFILRLYCIVLEELKSWRTGKNKTNLEWSFTHTNAIEKCMKPLHPVIYQMNVLNYKYSQENLMMCSTLCSQYYLFKNFRQYMKLKFIGLVWVVFPFRWVRLHFNGSPF